MKSHPDNRTTKQPLAPLMAIGLAVAHSLLAQPVITTQPQDQTNLVGKQLKG
jgi:hypothetical protein